MGVVAKGDNWKQRQKMRYMSMKDRMEEKAAQERPPPTREEVKCKYCGFKARYKFIRCPECNREQEVQK